MRFTFANDSLKKAFRLARKMKRKIMAKGKPTTHNHKDGSVFSPSHPKPTRLTPQKLEGKRAKGLCYSCDSVVVATTTLQNFGLYQFQSLP